MLWLFPQHQGCRIILRCQQIMKMKIFCGALLLGYGAVEDEYLKFKMHESFTQLDGVKLFGKPQGTHWISMSEPHSGPIWMLCNWILTGFSFRDEHVSHEDNGRMCCYGSASKAFIKSLYFLRCVLPQTSNNKLLDTKSLYSCSKQRWNWNTVVHQHW